MHYQFLIEDKSSEVLIKAVMQKLFPHNPNVTFDCKSFRGIGGFTRKNTVKETKTGKLLNDLCTYLKGFNRSLQNIAAAIFIVLDNDDRDVEEFKKNLEDVARQTDITIDYVFCIAVEEMEAWLLGDSAAIALAYPQARLTTLRTYVQDSICGTWEVLADVAYHGGRKQMLKECPTYMEIGRVKSAWAEKISPHMTLAQNASPSFQSFLAEIRRRMPA